MLLQAHAHCAQVLARAVYPEGVSVGQQHEGRQLTGFVNVLDVVKGGSSLQRIMAQDLKASFKAAGVKARHGMMMAA